MSLTTAFRHVLRSGASSMRASMRVSRSTRSALGQARLPSIQISFMRASNVAQHDDHAADHHDDHHDDHHHPREPAYVDPTWFHNLPPGQPVDHPLTSAALFPPDLNQPNAPSEEEYKSGKVKIPMIVDTLEWALGCPPPLHQFEEPPIVVEFPEHSHA